MAGTGIINVSVFNAARQPWGGPEVRMVLTDPFANSSNKKLVDKTLKKGTNQIVLEGVPADAGQRYILFLDADGHRSHSVFPVKPADDVPTPVNVMLIPNDPAPDFSAFSYNELQLRSPQFHQALSGGVAEGDFLGLPKKDSKFGLVRMAAVLNIEAKLRATALREGRAVDYVRKFNNLDCCERDRIKVEVAAEMPAQVKGLKSFNELNPDFNEVNHKGFPVSFKEKVAFCSLQLSFAKKPQAGTLSADIDIDLLTDVGHFGEVIRNKITKLKTDPFTVYVLLFDQGIRPLYTLKA
ncbi:MAG: hypothetical protein JOZ02_05345 [Acidobacteria bacterium]|nr:hypothetical protein [Acidobacteriota bacterium]